jgi:RNA polymerase sigma factor (sigma-70 family)
LRVAPATRGRYDQRAGRQRMTSDEGAGSMETSGKPDERYLLAALEYEGVLRASLYRYTRNRSDVDDLLQETYARLLIAGGSGQQLEIHSIRAFALTVARNVALDWLRRRSIVPIEAVADLEAMDVLDEGEQVEEIVNTQQELARLSDAVAQLPPRARQVFTLRKVYGYSQQEIARQLGISENTIEQHLQRAVRRCAQALFDLPVPERRTSFFARLRRHLKPQGEDD